MQDNKNLIFDKGRKGRIGVSLPECKIEGLRPDSVISKDLIRDDIKGLPSLSELDVIRHYTKLSQKNFSIDTNFYPLGSCSMKYNPKLNEKISNLTGFTDIHPLQKGESVQGALEIIWNLEKALCEITGMKRFTFQPSAGAHGELTAMFIVAKYFKIKRDKRTKVLVPDSSHGTNPASASMCGYEVVEVKTDTEGGVDLADLQSKIDKEVACLMLTNPNTLGLFEKDILDIQKIVHDKGGLLYYDGANLNALLGKVKPSDMGFDIVHLNLHKTFSTPHGGGGPGSGPVGVVDKLVDFLPIPLIDKQEGKFVFNYDIKKSIGKIRAFYGNFGVLVKAYAYILSLGAEGLEEVAEVSVLNANYILANLKKYYSLDYNRNCMHELVLSAKKQKQKGVNALDIAKRLIDYSIHPPTIYFPLIVEEALMIEPTETESKETLDYFIDCMVKIAEEVESNPDILHAAPHNAPVGRVDEVQSAREPDLRWNPETKTKDEG